LENKKAYLNKKNINLFFPISFILTIVPLIVRLSLPNPEQDALDIFGTGAKTELFSQKKAFFLILFSIILVIIAIIFFKKIFEKKDKIFNSILVSAGIFWLFTLLSSIFSPHRPTALWGIYDRAEGLITITCYIILFIYSIYTFKDTMNYKYIITPIIILVSVNSFLGLFQFIGQDLIKTNLGSAIVLPSEYRGATLNLLFEKGKLYGTLFHYDYVGSFVAMILPILFILTLFEDEDIMHKITLGIGTILSLWLLFGSTSRAGMIGVLFAGIFGVVLYWKLIKPKWKPLAIFFISMLAIVVGINFAAKGAIFERIPGLISDISYFFKDTSDFDYKNSIPIKDVKYTDKDAEIILQNETLKISFEHNDYVFKNSKDEVINYVKADAKDTKGTKAYTYTTTNEAFKNINFKSQKYSTTSSRADTLILNVDETKIFIFNLKQDNSIHMINANTRKDINIDFPETFGFKGKEQLGSARGYIWSRSIPLIKDNPILGGGPDTFVYNFPQNDLLGKYYAYGDPNTVVDKPHNLYLQIAVNEGLVALIAFLSIIAIYIFDSIKLYALKQEFKKSQILGSVTFLGIIGYLFAGIFNDSVVSVAPVFWIVLGVGVALNYMNRTNLNKTHK
jgi:hypothetical protein